MAFHRSIGVERKAARWVERLAAERERVNVLTNLTDPTKAGAIGFFAVDGIYPNKPGAWPYDKLRVVTTPIVFPEFSGVRITPNVYTTADEADLFADKVREAIRRGVA